MILKSKVVGTLIFGTHEDFGTFIFIYLFILLIPLSLSIFRMKFTLHYFPDEQLYYKLVVDLISLFPSFHPQVPFPKSLVPSSLLYVYVSGLFRHDNHTNSLSSLRVVSLLSNLFCSPSYHPLSGVSLDIWYNFWNPKIDILSFGILTNFSLQYNRLPKHFLVTLTTHLLSNIPSKYQFSSSTQPTISIKGSFFANVFLITISSILRLRKTYMKLLFRHNLNYTLYCLY